MENTYGIGITNRFELFLDDESDPFETIKLKEQEKELKKKTKVAEKENKVKTEAPVKPKPPVQKKPKEVTAPPTNKPEENRRNDAKPAQQRNNADGRPERVHNKYSNENREERNNRRNRDDKQFNNGPLDSNREREERPRRGDNNGDNFESRNKGARQPGGGKPGPRGPRRTFDDRRGKREFDRQSGSDKTGVKPVDKRDGAGAHNWGSHKDVIEEADKSNEIDQRWGDFEKSGGEAPANAAPEVKEGGGEPETEQAPVEEEPKELTLDEWKAQRAGRQKPQFNIRKAGEGEDPSQWKKMYELNKKKDGAEEGDTDDEEYDASEYPQRVGRQKHLLDIDIHFNDARRSAGGRGPRGPRAGGPRGNRNNQRGGGGAGAGGPGAGTGTGASAGTGAGAGEKQGSRYRGNEEQAEERQQESRIEPKFDDERDFPSLG